MKKRSMHNIHLEDGVWKWYVKGQRKPVVIFAPSGKRSELKPVDYLRFSGKKDSDHWDLDGLQGMVNNMAYTITPAVIKEYIIQKLKNEVLCVA